MRALPKSGEIWVHFKGEDKKYLIITVATHTETHEQFVVYKALYGDFKDYIRPYTDADFPDHGNTCILCIGTDRCHCG